MELTNLITKNDIVEGLYELGIHRGSLIMLHSSLSSIGNVEGGAETVVDGLLDVIGPGGTLVVPTFTYPTAYVKSRDPKWIFDPSETYSGMGAITNAVRRRPETRRSIHLWHSIAVRGLIADKVTTIGGTSAWDSESPMSWVFRN